MKKLLVTSLAIAVLGISFCAVVDVQILHKHAEAAVQMIHWQCERCGQRAWLRAGTMPASLGCGGDFNQRHIWHRM